MVLSAFVERCEIDRYGCYAGVFFFGFLGYERTCVGVEVVDGWWYVFK